MWIVNFPENGVANLVSFEKPKVSVTYSNLELMGGILHNECFAQRFDV